MATLVWVVKLAQSKKPIFHLALAGAFLNFQNFVVVYIGVKFERGLLFTSSEKTSARNLKYGTSLLEHLHFKYFYKIKRYGKSVIGTS
jgi:hypothetical protein